MKYRFYPAYSLICIALLAQAALTGEVQPLQGKVRAVLQSLPDDPAEPIWQQANQLAEIGEPAREPLLEAIKGGSPAITVAAGFALCRLGEHRAAVEALNTLVQDPAAPLQRRQEGATIMIEEGGDLGRAKIRFVLNNARTGPGGQLPEVLQVTCACGLFKLSNNADDYKRLRRIMADGRSGRARIEATFALAQNGYFQDVRESIESLRKQPGDLGERADVLAELHARAEQMDKSDRLPGLLVNEVMLRLRRDYAPDRGDKREDEQLTAKNIAAVAAQAVLSSIDPFSDYLTEDDMKDMLESLHSNYGGIGAWVGMREGAFTILTPMYGKPAYRAGLRSMDVVEKIDDTDIRDMRLNEIIKLLKGPADTKVKVVIRRQGWLKPREFDIVRDTIDVPSVIAQSLPGDIGYIRLNTFADGDAAKGVKGTDELLRAKLGEFKAAGARGIVLDLTNNSGGLLTTAINVVKLFVGESKLIVTKRGRQEDDDPEPYIADPGEPFYGGPLVVLINRGSASASEIVAGALQDHGRAILVGERSFGKGSIQQPIPAWTTRGHIKLTIGYYYLPSGRCIHGPYREDGGIQPQRKVEDSDVAGMSAAEFELRWGIRESHVIEKWLDAHFKAREQAFREQLGFDGYSWESYPEFDSLLTALQEKYPDADLTRELVRKELRSALIAYLHHSRGEDVYIDPQENELLQHGIITLSEGMAGGLPDLPLYKAILERVNKRETKKMAAATDAAAPKSGENAVPLEARPAQ